MNYIQESSTWRDRRRHRQQITLVVVLLLLVVAGGVGYAYYSGAFSGSKTVNVATLPPCTAPSATPLTPDKETVNVYNATNRNGIAGKTATAMSARGFVVAAVANDPLRAKVPGAAVVRHGPQGKEAAQFVAARVAGAKLILDKRKGESVDLVLGTKYAGLEPVPAPTTTPVPTCRPVSPSAPASSTPTATSTPPKTP